MKNTKRDKFLAKAMGIGIEEKYGCYSDFSITPMKCVMDTQNYFDCVHAKKGFDKTTCRNWRKIPKSRIDFSEWHDFGILWDWAIKQEWWREFLINLLYENGVDTLISFIHPDRFANAVYEFLKGKTCFIKILTQFRRS